jgi:outer membrane usher protein
MSTLPHALFHKSTPLVRVLILVLLACVLIPQPSRAEEQLIVFLTLNQQKMGDFFVYNRDDGDFLLRMADLREIGVQLIEGDTVQIDEDTYISLTSMEGVEFFFEESFLTLELTAAPRLLPKATIDLAPSRRDHVIRPRDTSFFLNYGFDYSTGGESFVFDGLTVSNEVGARFRDLLLLTDSVYSESSFASSFVRLNSSLIWDERETMRRVIAGDFFAFSGELGSRTQMGGLSLSKVYRIDPYFIRYPLFDFTGQVALPSEVELYVEGVRVRSERFAPGEFELRNFQGIGGAQTVEVVIRDSFGREQRLVSPFYFTDQLLRRGLHEYSYNLGFLREDFGVESNRYGDMVASAFHRLGVTDTLNVGLRGEVGNGVVNFGVESLFKIHHSGLLWLQAGASGGDHTGASGLVRYEFQNRWFRARLGLQGFSEGYRVIGDGAGARRKANIIAGVGYQTPQIGSFGFDYVRSEYFEQTGRETTTLSWSRRLVKSVYTTAFIRRVRESNIAYEGGVNVSWHFDHRHSLAGSVRRERDADIQTIEARRNIPLGEGTGWNLRAERAEQREHGSHLLNSVIQHNARHAVLRGDLSLGQSNFNSNSDLRLSASGALVHIGGATALTRPVTDSFALVSVGKAADVRVYLNGQPFGRTGQNGWAVITGLSSYYENQISIDDKDIPIDYLMPRVRTFVSPPLRSGSCISFPLQQFQAYTGTIHLENSSGRSPLKYAELILEAPGGTVTFWTGGGGEFYLDNQMSELDLAGQQGCAGLQAEISGFLFPGTYPLVILQEGRSFSSSIDIPSIENTFAELGEIVLRAPSPETQKASEHIGVEEE